MHDSDTGGRRDHRLFRPDGLRAEVRSEVREALHDVVDAFDHRTRGHRHHHHHPDAHRDVRGAVLALLSEQPMPGDEIIRSIQDRSNGAWQPSPGSVYPMLQLLVDEQLAEATTVDGKKTYTLTETGRAEAEAATGPAPWDAPAAPDPTHRSALPRAGAKLARAAMQVGRDGTPTQVGQAVTVLDEARRRLHAILAQD